MKTILVAGGAGFIGSNLVKALVELNHDIIVVDDFSTGNIQKLPKGVRVINSDIRGLTYVHDMPKLDIIFNLACPASPIAYQKYPFNTLDTNYNGTLKLLKLAEKNNAIFIQASTSEVYGNPLVHPQTEDYFGNVNMHGPRSCYDEGKRVAETLCYLFNEAGWADTRIARIFNTYGPGMDANDGRVIPNFIMQALNAEDITVHDPNRTRSFCYVSDTVSALIRLITHKPKGPVNVGNEQEIRIADLAILIRDMIGPRNIDGKKRESYIRFTDEIPVDDPERRRPDVTKANKELDWFPAVPLSIGLVETIKYFESL